VVDLIEAYIGTLLAVSIPVHTPRTSWSSTPLFTLQQNYITPQPQQLKYYLLVLPLHLEEAVVDLHFHLYASTGTYVSGTSYDEVAYLHFSLHPHPVFSQI